MSSELREALTIAIECILFSLVLLVISFFGKYSQEALVIKNSQNIAMSDITEYKSMYEFSGGKEISVAEIKKLAGAAPYAGLTEATAKSIGTEITGDDVVRFLGMYPSVYNVYIYTGPTISTSDCKILSPQNSLADEWKMTTVSDWMGVKVTQKYYCVVVYNDNTYEYDSVIFKIKTK